MAVMASFAYSQDATQATSVITQAGYYYGNDLSLDGTVIMQGGTDFAGYDGPALFWLTDAGEAIMSGQGKLVSSSTTEYWDFAIVGDSEMISIGSGVEMENVDIVFDVNASSARLSINGTLSNFDINGYNAAVIDLSRAERSGRQMYDFDGGCTFVVNELEVKENVFIELSYGYQPYATLQGNLVLNGALPSFAGEQRFDYTEDGWHKIMMPYGAVQFWVSGDDPYMPLNVTGSITIKSATAIVFANEGEYEHGADSITTYISNYRLPESTDVLFICSSVNEESLSLLKPYAYREDSWADYSGENEVLGGYEYIKPVDDREFYAKAGADGRVYIYLGDASTDSGGDAPSVPSDPAAGSIVLNDLTLADADDYGSFTIRGKNLELSGNWIPPYLAEEERGVAIEWIAEDSSATYALTGSGILGDNESIVELDICGPGQFAIAKDVTISNSVISMDESERGGEGTILSVEGTLHNANVYVGRGTLKLDNVTLSGYQFYELEPGSVVHYAELNLSAKRSGLSVYNFGEVDSYANPKIVGNLVLDGQGSYFGNTEKTWTGESVDLVVGSHAFNPVVIFEKNLAADGKYTTLEITGSLTVKSETAVLFGVWDETYSIPGTDDSLIICASVNEGGLKLLAPYAQRADYEYTTGEYTGYTKPLENYEFFARSGADGRVYIYLGEKASGGEPEIPVLPDLTVKPGETTVLGGNGGLLPSIQNPVKMQGGVADASGMEDALLNNNVITGESGTLLTGHNQTMQLTGGGEIGYSIAGLEGSQHGADLEISSTSNLTLAGEKYDAARIKVQNGTVTISSGTNIGTGADGDVLDLTSKAVSATNFGTIAADVEIANESTLLNQGQVKGDVSIQGKSAAMVNNGSVDGLVTVGSGALLSGSGAAGALILESGAALNVGNSPGYQKYGNLTLSRGSVVSFTVDGVQAATQGNAGSGTHSVLIADELNIAAGSGAVTINVEVTMGIVSAGADPVEVTLASAGKGNATAADFTIKLDDNGLLEEGAEVSWDAATQSLTLSGAVSKAALAALMDSNSANVANTMWASSNAVHEFARTAENQFLVGMPGQTTFWGAGIGSFMDVGGKQGFTSNAGGYAVGLQHGFTESFRAGVALGQTFGSFKSDDNQLRADQASIMPALTAQYVKALSKSSSLSVSGHVAYGVVENEADIYQAGTAGKAEWVDGVLNIGVRASWNRQMTDNTTMSLFTGLTYQQVKQDDFQEKFTGGVRDYRDGSMSSLSIPVGVTVRGIYHMEGTNIFVPEVTMAYIGDVARDNPEVKTSVYGFNREGKGTNVGRSAFMLQAGANWMFDSTWSVGAFYALEARSNQVNQSVNAALRCSF